MLAQTSVRSNTRSLVGIVSSLDICDVVADDQLSIVFCSAMEQTILVLGCWMFVGCWIICQSMPNNEFWTVCGNWLQTGILFLTRTGWIISPWRQSRSSPAPGIWWHGKAFFYNLCFNHPLLSVYEGWFMPDGQLFRFLAVIIYNNL